MKRLAVPSYDWHRQIGRAGFCLPYTLIAMPKAAKPLKRSSTSQRSVLRRSSEDDEARKWYRREVLGGPGPIDCWLCANSSAVFDMERPQGEDEVQCTVEVQVQKVCISHPRPRPVCSNSPRLRRMTASSSIRTHTC